MEFLKRFSTAVATVVVATWTVRLIDGTVQKIAQSRAATPADPAAAAKADAAAAQAVAQAETTAEAAPATPVANTQTPAADAA
jgi:hypothetical protein